MAGSSSHYDVLGLRADASGPAIRAAYRCLALELHPDKAGELARPRFDKVQAAYEVLREDASRAEYDAALQKERTTTLRSSVDIVADDCDEHEDSTGNAVLSAACRCGASFQVDLSLVETAGAEGVVVSCSSCSLKARIYDEPA